VSLNKRRTDILCKRLHWTNDIPDAVRADYDVSKVDSRLQALGNVALSPRGVVALVNTTMVMKQPNSQRLEPCF